MATRFYSSVEYGGQRASNDADTIYYNATIINNDMSDTVGNVVNPPVSFNEVRQQPIVESSNDYMASAIAITSNGATRDLPLWIPRIQTSSVQCVFIGQITAGVLTVKSISKGALSSGLIINSASANSNVTATVGAQLSGSPGGVGTYALTFSSVPNTAGALLFNAVTEQNDVNLTVYSLTLMDISSGIPVQVFLKWVPENTYVPAPTTPIIFQNLSTEYYYSYTFQTFVNMFNTALDTALTSLGYTSLVGTFYLVNLETIAGASNIPSQPTGSPALFGLYGSLTEASKFKMYFNTALESMLPNIPGFFENKSLGMTFSPTLTLTSPNPPGDVDKLIFRQDYPGVSSWSPVESLIVTSQLLPVINEQCPPPARVGGSSANTLGDVVPGSFLPILGEMLLPSGSTSTSDWRQYLLTQSPNEYKMISLSSNDSPIQNIDLQVWWRNRYNNGLYPLRLVAGSSISIKIMFRRKQLGV